MSLTILLIGESVLGLLAAYYGILAAKNYQGGALATALKWIVIGQITMSIGHIVMAVDMVKGIDIFVDIFGPIGMIIFRVVVIISLGASAVGFYHFWNTTKQ